MKGFLEVLGRLWRAIPLKLMLLLTLAGLYCGKLQSEESYKRVKGEWYPLSIYPMYSRFEGRDYYLYLADGAGEAVPCKDFGLTAPKLKKRFKSDLKTAGLKESELRARELPPAEIGRIAAPVLENVARAREPHARLSAGDELTLVLVHVFSEGGEIKKESYRVAGVTLGE